MDFLDILREKAFLGREFLTWLWFKSEQTGGAIELPGQKVIEVIFLDRMTLDLSDAGNSADSLAEGRAFGASRGFGRAQGRQENRGSAYLHKVRKR